MSANPNDLESFRRQWQEEVQRRRGAAGQQVGNNYQSAAGEASQKCGPKFYQGLLPNESRTQRYDEDYASQTYDFDDLEERQEARKLGVIGTGVHPESRRSKEPVSALEHYEEAVERERQGKLGESLSYYRKAYRLDDAVDQKYKNKHFPPSSFSKAKSKLPLASPPAVSATTAPSGDQSSTMPYLTSLVASFADEPINPAHPIISGDIAPSCPISLLPSELLSDIILTVALTDIASLPKLALVCKRLAYLISGTSSLWKHLAHTSQYGLPGMHFTFATTLEGQPLSPSLISVFSSLSLSLALKPPPLPISLTAPYPTYKSLLRSAPRLRFCGVYISTVNYARPGASSPNQVTWNTPVHIVTYYRYLRFYRDGTCVSLLTTTEPVDVVPYLQRENIGTHETLNTTLPVSVMKWALRGRWRMARPAYYPAPIPPSFDAVQEDFGASISNANPNTEYTRYFDHPPSSSPLHPKESEPVKQEAVDEGQEVEEEEGALTIETEGPTRTYQYSLHLCLKSARTTTVENVSGTGPAQNTKLVWRGFWSYNRLTDDWAEFGLRNDRAFVWSRVRSWGEA